MPSPTDIDQTIILQRYQQAGFVVPITGLTSEQAGLIRADLESAEAALADQPEKLALLYKYPERLLPSFDRLVRNPYFVAAAAAVLGDDLLVWSAGMFIKEAQSPKIVSWHQDLTYWGLDDAEETTCWVALSPASTESGCMKFVPGSHTRQIVPHHDTFAADNLLSRGQEIAVDVNEADSVAAELLPGQASLHHGHLFHSSGPNRTDDRRIGVAIRYIKPSMKQQSGIRPLVSLVSGTDHYGHFTLAEPPTTRLDEREFERCRSDLATREKVLMAGATTGG